MASHTKTYFLSPNWEYPPEGLIQLGSLITDPKKPQRSLNKGALVTIDPANIYHSPKTNWKQTRAQLNEVRVGVWASFLQIIGFGGDASYNRTRDSSEVFKCSSLETNYFQPDDKYIFESLQNPFVKSYIGDTFHKKPVYMITGVKIVRGFTVSTTKSKKYGADAKLGADATSLGAAVQAGPNIKISSKISEDVSFGRSSDCVFAYQLIKIRSRRNDKFVEDFNKGALLNTNVEEREDGLEQLHEDWDVEELRETLPNSLHRTTASLDDTTTLTANTTMSTTDTADPIGNARIPINSTVVPREKIPIATVDEDNGEVCLVIVP